MSTTAKRPSMLEREVRNMSEMGDLYLIVNGLLLSSSARTTYMASERLNAATRRREGARSSLVEGGKKRGEVRDREAGRAGVYSAVSYYLRAALPRCSARRSPLTSRTPSHLRLLAETVIRSCCPTSQSSFSKQHRDLLPELL